jgi:hypothetical protein
MSWASPKASPDIKATAEEGRIEVRLRSSLAMAIAFRILRGAGRISVHPDRDA